MRWSHSACPGVMEEWPMKMQVWLAAIAAAQFTMPLAAHDLTVDECMEAGEFIMHAAMSRDAGTTREEFVGRMREDLFVILAYPPELRWFVQDQADEELLVSHAEGVFDQPVTPEAHESDFLRACFNRLGDQARLSDARVRAAQVDE